MSDNIQKKLLKEIPLFKHKTEGQVKFHEVDSFGVLHNIQYFYILEWARTQYFQYIGMPMNRNTYTLENPVMTVNHEINYYHPAMFTDLYEVFSRITEVRNSSLKFENIIMHSDGNIMAKASAVLVYLSTDDYKPARIPDDFREKIKNLEADNVTFIEKN